MGAQENNIKMHMKTQEASLALLVDQFRKRAEELIQAPLQLVLFGSCAHWESHLNIRWASCFR
jgi:hypothetical protein